MPAWLIQILISLALKFGVPELLKLFPNLPPNISDIIQKLIADLQGLSAAKSDVVKKAKADVADACTSLGCPPDVIKTDA